MAARIIKKSWWVDFRFDHARYRKKSPENSRAGALAYEATLRQKLARGEPIANAPLIPERQKLFSEFAWLWFDKYVVSNNKPSEQRNKQHILGASLVPFFGNKSVTAISAYNVEEYKSAELKRCISRKSINTRLSVLRKCLATAYDWWGVREPLPKIVWLKEDPAKTDYLSSDECKLLFSQADGTMREMVLTALRTGMRQGEIRGLQWGSIDWQNRTITVRHSLCDFTGKLQSPKSNRERHIPMDIDLYLTLFARRRSTGYVFSNMLRGNRPFTGQFVERELAGLCKQAGLRKIGWHVLRHTFASHLASRGVPLNAVQALLGHSHITTTMRYAHLAPSTLRAAIDMLNPKTIVSAAHGQPAGNQWVEAIQSGAKDA